MPPSHLALRVSLVSMLATVFAGCANSPFNMSPGAQALRSPQSAPQQQPIFGQYRDLHSRAAGLDANNQNLHAVLAQQQQQTAQYKAALEQSRQEVAQLRSQVDAPGGANIAGSGTRARNASHQGGALTVARISGAEVVPDGDLVRIRLESSQLFAPGKAELKSEVNSTLDRVAAALKSDYAGHMVGIEGHTDSDPITKSKWKNNHELAVARSVALFTALKQRGVPESQLFVAGYGPNRPLSTNSSKQAKSQNRRVEIVVYPESAG